MSLPVKTRLIKIGNSQGIRIPKLLLDQVGLRGEVEVEAQVGQLVIRPAQLPRQGWDIQFKAMAEAGEDTLVDEEPLTLNTWEETEWHW